jgi:hypothetical protein
MQIAKVGESARNSKTSKRSHTHTQEGESAEYKEQGRETTGNERKGKKGLLFVLYLFRFHRSIRIANGFNKR